ncbi:ABC-type multidrug transport system [Cutibacterium acnes JCM 18920]|nr:ABC-type multidrug transport system [Cutibacterium acnes JCM 18920]
MTTLDLHPAPQAAPAAARVRNHALTEVRLVMRNGEQLLLALVIPIDHRRRALPGQPGRTDDGRLSTLSAGARHLVDMFHFPSDHDRF